MGATETRCSRHADLRQPDCPNLPATLSPPRLASTDLRRMSGAQRAPQSIRYCASNLPGDFPAKHQPCCFGVIQATMAPGPQAGAVPFRCAAARQAVAAGLVTAWYCPYCPAMKKYSSTSTAVSAGMK